MKTLSFLFFLLLTIGLAQADVEISAQLKYSNYLLYERVDMYVTIFNNSDSTLELASTPGHPWLNFIVSQHNGIPLAPQNEPTYPKLVLKPAETRVVQANITPLCKFRQPGDYRCSAVVDVQGLGQIVIQPACRFNVAEGRNVWTESRPVEGSQRVYSLIRFSPQADRTALYLRVEDLAENIVYANIALGNVVSYIDPDVFFDPQGKLHVIQPIAMGTYLYSRTDANGHIEHQGVFCTDREVAPHLSRLPDGSVIVQGGVAVNKNGPPDRLSDTLSTSIRAGKNKAMTEPLAEASENSPAKNSTPPLPDAEGSPGSGSLPK